MDSRRRFLKFGLGTCAAGITAVSGRVFSMSAPGRAGVVPYYKAIFDERFESACEFAAGAAERGITTAAIRGDITNLFYNDLDLRWKQGPVPLAGYTTPASLFCLDLLARDRGMRVIHRAPVPGVEAALGMLGTAPPRRGLTARVTTFAPRALVFWIIAPSTAPHLVSTSFELLQD